MGSRFLAYTILLLSSLLLSIIPVAIENDLATPFDKWETWYWLGQPHPRPNFAADNIPFLLRAEQTVFKWLVVPPGILSRVVHGFPTNYSIPWVSPGSSTEAAASLPPLALAFEHLRWAVPFWSVCFIGSYELGLGMRRWRGRRQAKGRSNMLGG